VTRENVELLWEACGARSPLTLEVEHTATQLVNPITFSLPFATLGRAATNDVVLDHFQVSRRHAYLQLIGGRIFCVDFSSRTGTHWPGGTSSGWVDDGQSVQIGPCIIRPKEFTPDPNATRSLFAAAYNPLQSFETGQEPFSDFTIHFIKGVREQSAWPLRRVLALVGSSPQCKMQLVDPRVSRYHCSLLRTPLGTWVIDLMGRGGVRVNGARVRFARLYDGDELKIGVVVVRIECDTRPSATVVDPSVEHTANLIDAGDATEAGAVSTPSLLIGKIESSRASSPTTLELESPGALRSPHTNLVAAPPTPSVPRVVDQENLISVLVYQFGQMQQQMADQFQQAVMTMVQMFSTFHRDQMDLVREELNRLHELNAEIVAIQAELASQHPPRLPQNQSANKPRVTTKLRASVQSYKSLEGRPASESSPATVIPCADRASKLDAAIPAGAEALAQVESILEVVRVEMSGVSQPLDVAEHVLGISDSNDQSRDGENLRKGARIDNDRPSGDDAHAWLWQRMEAIRSEQQSLWQRILTTVRTKVTGASTD
jgi:pSer/pThr/pTyr-binding forkhead associated (FHA) protein